MNVYVQLMSGDTLSFEIFEGYKFRNLRGEFYDRMSDEFSIRELECIVIFDENKEVNIDELVIDDKTYRILVNNICVCLCYDDIRNTIRFEHKYESFPFSSIVKITESVTRHMDKTYKVLYEELESGYQNDIDFYNDGEDPDVYYDDTSPTFKEYSENKYGGDPEFEDIVKEYINYFIKSRFNIEEFVYEY